jgi:RNA polymerase sporulation-specific sigma factor
MVINYENQSDDMLISSAASGDEEALAVLYGRYKGMIRGKANLYFLVGGDKDDLIQEGMIGLFSAVMSYEPDGEAAFPTYAELCVNRQMLNAVRSDNRVKHKPLNAAISIYEAQTNKDDSASKLEEVLADPAALSPEDQVVTNDLIARLEQDIIDVFSDFEKEVWQQFIAGKQYKEIAESLNRTPKTIDNAIQRIKKKLEKLL